MKAINKVRITRLFKQLSAKNINLTDLDQAEQRASFLKERGEDFKTLVAMCRDSIKGRYELDKWSVSVVVGTILYVVSPLDAIPDLVPVLGWLDDVTIVGYAINKLSNEIIRYRNFQAENLIKVEATKSEKQ